VIELRLAKVNGIVAPIARQSHPPVVRILVASRALTLSSLVRPLEVTALAGRRSVSAKQGIGVIVQRIRWKSDSARGDRGAWCGAGLCQRLFGHRRRPGRCPWPPGNPQHGTCAQGHDQQQDQQRT
jgi:hypothetical protein